MQMHHLKSLSNAVYMRSLLGENYRKAFHLMLEKFEDEVVNPDGYKTRYKAWCEYLRGNDEGPASIRNVPCFLLNLHVGNAFAQTLEQTNVATMVAHSITSLTSIRNVPCLLLNLHVGSAFAHNPEQTPATMVANAITALYATLSHRIHQSAAASPRHFTFSSATLNTVERRGMQAIARALGMEVSFE